MPPSFIPFFGDPLPFQLIYSLESVMRPEYFTFDDVSIWGLSFLSVSQCSSLLSVGILLICSNFLSLSLWAFGLSSTIRMPSFLAQTWLLWEYRWWSLQTYVSLWAASPLVHVSVSNSCFLFCLHMIKWGIMISYPILCVSNQHIGGYHGSHGSKWIFGLIPPPWISRSVTSVLPACDLLQS